MAIEVFSSDFCVDFQSMQETSFAIKENDFTAGYTQRDADGINNIRDTWNVSFSDMPYTEMVDAWGFLQRHKGYKAFLWTPPRDTVERRWVCTKLRRTMNSANSWSISATFQERFVYLVGQIKNTHLFGVQATALRGIITPVAEIAEGNQPVNGVEGTAIPGSIFPNTVLPDFFSIRARNAIYTAGHVATDGYLYVRAYARYIFKIDRSSFALVGIFDCILDGGETLAAADFGNTEGRAINSDATYLYFAYNKSGSGKLFRLLLSDFSTFDKLSVITTAYTFIYGGYLWWKNGTNFNRLSLSDFSTVTTLSLSSFVATGNTLANTTGVVVFDHYCIFALGTGTKITIRIDLDDFTTGGVTTLDISDAFNRQTRLGQFGVYDATYVYFPATDNRIYRIKRDLSAFDVYTLGPGAKPDYTFGFVGIHLKDDYLYVLSGDSGAPYLVKIDLTSDDGTFSALDHIYINVIERVLGSNPAGDRTPIGFQTFVGDDTWIYCFPWTNYQFTNGFPIMRVPLSSESFDPYPLPTLFSSPPEQMDWDWVGDDMAPTITPLVTLAYSVYPGLRKINQRRYIIAIAVRFAAGGVVTSMSIGGQQFTLIKEKTSGALYVGIWMLDPVASSDDVTFELNGSDNIYYFTGEIYTIDNTNNFDVIFTDEQSGNGKSATFDYTADQGGFAYAVVAVDSVPTDWNIVVSDAEWGRDNYDYWGPETDFGNTSLFLMQVSAQDRIAADIVGGSLTVNWDSPPDTEDLDWIGILVSISFKDPNPDPSAFIAGVEGKCIGYGNAT